MVQNRHIFNNTKDFYMKNEIMLFFLQKPPTNTQNVYMKYISYLKILNIAVHNYYTECCFCAK